MEMLNKLLNYGKNVLQGIFCLLIIMHCSQIMTMGKSFDIEEVEEYNPYGNEMVIQTQDQDFVTVDKKHLDFFQTLTNAFNDTETFDETLPLQISTENYNALVRFCFLVDHIDALKTQKKEFKQKSGVDYQIIENGLFKNKKKLANYVNTLKNNKISIIDLVNAGNYLGCSAVSYNLLLKMIAQYTEEAYIPSSNNIQRKQQLNKLLKSISKYDIPNEVSVHLGRKFIEHYTFNKLYNLIKDIIRDKDIEAYAVSSDKKYCTYIENGEVFVADVSNKKGIAKIDLNATGIKDHISTVTDMSFSPDGTMLAIVVTLKDNKSALYIYLLDQLKNIVQGVENNQSLCMVKDSSIVDLNIINISFSPCSNKLLISGDNKEVIEWDIDGESLTSFKDNGSLASAFFTYNQEGEKVEDRLSQYRKKMRQLMYNYTNLHEELYSLKAEHVFLFVQIVKSSVDTGKFNLHTTPYTKACYTYLMTKPSISAAIKELTSKQSYCTIS